MKKTILIFLIVSLFVLSACSTKKSAPTEPDESPSITQGAMPTQVTHQPESTATTTQNTQGDLTDDDIMPSNTFTPHPTVTVYPTATPTPVPTPLVTAGNVQQGSVDVTVDDSENGNGEQFFN